MKAGNIGVPLGDEYCTCCGLKLDSAKIVYLELNCTTGRYCEPGTVPPHESQGAFPFGSQCARLVLSGRPLPSRPVGIDEEEQDYDAPLD